MPKTPLTTDSFLPLTSSTSTSPASSEAPVAESGSTQVDAFDKAPGSLFSKEAEAKRLPTIVEVDETLPEAGVPYTTHGGETLREIAREAYGDESMVLALVAIHGCGADRVLPKGAQITLPAPATIDTEDQQDAALLEEKASRASMAAMLAGTESHHNIMHSAMDALNGSTTRNIDRSTPFSLADTDPNVRPETERSTILGAELDRELRGLKTTGHEISTQTEGDAEVHFESTNTATIGNPDRERPDATLDAEGRDADADPELMDAFTPFKADDIEKLELDRIKDQAKLDVSSIEKKAVNRADGSPRSIQKAVAHERHRWFRD